MLNKCTQHPLCHQDGSVIKITRPQLKLLTKTSASTGSKHEHRGAVFHVLEIRSNRWLRAPQRSIERDERANYKLTVKRKDRRSNHPFYPHTQQTRAASWSCSPRTPNLLGVNAGSKAPVRAGPRQLKIYFCGFRGRFPWISGPSQSGSRHTGGTTRLSATAPPAPSNPPGHHHTAPTPEAAATSRGPVLPAGLPLPPAGRPAPRSSGGRGGKEAHGRAGTAEPRSLHPAPGTRQGKEDAAGGAPAAA